MIVPLLRTTVLRWQAVPVRLRAERLAASGGPMGGECLRLTMTLSGRTEKKKEENEDRRSTAMRFSVAGPSFNKQKC